MKPVKVMPRFKCDFCKRRSTKAAMEKHERNCFRNPNRVCDVCKNTGFEDVEIDNPWGGVECVKQPCWVCAKFDPEKLAAIEAYERNHATLDA